MDVLTRVAERHVGIIGISEGDINDGLRIRCTSLRIEGASNARVIHTIQLVTTIGHGIGAQLSFRLEAGIAVQQVESFELHHIPRDVAAPSGHLMVNTMDGGLTTDVVAIESQTDYLSVSRQRRCAHGNITMSEILGSHKILGLELHHTHPSTILMLIGGPNLLINTDGYGQRKEQGVICRLFYVSDCSVNASISNAEACHK